MCADDFHIRHTIWQNVNVEIEFSLFYVASIAQIELFNRF